jgi:hypothetical protein
MENRWMVLPLYRENYSNPLPILVVGLYTYGERFDALRFLLTHHWLSLDRFHRAMCSIALSLPALDEKKLSGREQLICGKGKTCMI